MKKALREYRSHLQSEIEERLSEVNFDPILLEFPEIFGDEEVVRILDELFEKGARITCQSLYSYWNYNGNGDDIHRDMCIYLYLDR
jgi:hypothetical protein